MDDRWLAAISKREIDRIVSSSDSDQIVYDAVDRFIDRVADIVEPGGPTVIVCAPPTELLASLEVDAVRRRDPVDEELDEGSEPGVTRDRLKQPYFQDLLKAAGMRLNTPIQMIRPQTFGGNTTRGRRNGGLAKRPLHK